MPVRRGDKNFLTVPEASERAGVSEGTIIRECGKKALHCIKDRGGGLLISEDSLQNIGGDLSIIEKERSQLQSTIESTRKAIEPALERHPELSSPLQELIEQYLRADKEALAAALRQSDPEGIAAALGTSLALLQPQIERLTKLVRPLFSEDPQLANAAEVLRQRFDREGNP